PADEVSETFIGTASFGGTVDVYRFDATLPTSFAPTPGTPYWLMVRSFAPTTSPGFHWSVGLGDDDESVQDEIAVQRFFRDGDRAFTLFVPEPAGSLGAGAAAAVLAALARRRATRESTGTQNGYAIGVCWTVTQWSVVNSSITHWPLKRPMPLFFSPPNGLFGMSLTLVSLTCVMPTWSPRAKRTPR